MRTVECCCLQVRNKFHIGKSTVICILEEFYKLTIHTFLYEIFFKDVGKFGN